MKELIEGSVKIIKTIRTSTGIEHIEACEKMVSLFCEKYKIKDYAFRMLINIQKAKIPIYRLIELKK